MHPALIAVYLRGMMQRNSPPQPPRSSIVSPKELLEFRPWMLALAVFLACALGIAVMEQFRYGRVMWAQAEQQQAQQQASR